MGLGRRRLLRAGRAAPHARAARALDRARRPVGRHAHPGQRVRPATRRAPAAAGPRDPAALARDDQAAHALVALPRRGARPVPPDRPAAHAPPRAHASRRSRADRPRRPVPARRRPARRAGARSPARPPARLRLPAGAWVHLGRDALLRGPRTVTVRAPIGEPPLLVRAGAVLPMLPDDVRSLSRHADAPGGVDRTRRARAPARAARPVPRGRSTSRLGPDGTGTARSVEDAGGWTLHLRSRTVRRVTVDALLGALRRPFRPCAIRGAASARRTGGGLRATVVLRRGRATLRALRSC